MSVSKGIQACPCSSTCDACSILKGGGSCGKSERVGVGREKVICEREVGKKKRTRNNFVPEENIGRLIIGNHECDL